MPRLTGALTLAALALASAFSPTELDEASGQLLQLASRIGQDIDSPTLVLAGHHNDGKSALLQALLGVQLTHVGSSMSTRRVLRIELQFDPDRDSPALFLCSGEGADERQLSPAELSTHIEAENTRLAERGQYEAKPLRVRLAWRGAPNLVLVDTPGLLSPPTGQALPDAALTKAAAEVERLVLAEIEPAGRLILCLEDTADWALPLTRAVVARADPHFRRSVLVATKLDSKVAQFAMADDLHRLLNPRAVAAAHPQLLAGPIFTSIPPLRNAKAPFRDAISQQETSLCGFLVERLGTNAYASRIGVDSLQRALQPHIASRWAQVLSSCSKSLEARIEHLQAELSSPPPPPAAESLDDFAERFARSVHGLLKGSVALPAGEYGETLRQERSRSGSGALCHLDAPLAAAADAAVDAAAEPSEAQALASGEEGTLARDENVEFALHAEKRLYGGAQYWRVLQEFMLGAIEEPMEELTSEEILNAMGFDGFHDGVNYMRAVCVIVVERARGYFEGSLERLRRRLLHVMGRLSALVDAQLREEELREQRGQGRGGELGRAEAAGVAGCARGLSAEQHARYMAIAAPLFARFVEEKMEACMSKCRHDVEAITKYVVWDQTSASKDSLYQVFIEPVAARMKERRAGRAEGRKGGKADGGFATYEELVSSFTEVLTSRRVSEQMRELMSELVVEIVSAWRHEFVRMISLKLNSFFLMPFCETLPSFMRRSLFRLEGEQLAGLEQLPTDGAAHRTERLQGELSQLSGEKAALLQITQHMRRQRGATLPHAPMRKGS